MPTELEEEIRKIGLPPGTLIHVGGQKTEHVEMSTIDYDADRLWEKDVPSPEDFMASKNSPSITWISVNGLHELKRIEEMGKFFDLHHLLLEDVVNTEQRPKMDEFEDHLYFVIKILSYDKPNHQIQEEQISLILGNNFVISFSENQKGFFDPIRKRLRKGQGRIRKMGADYLIYSLLDLIVDNYFILLNQLEEVLEDTEGDLINENSSSSLQEMYYLKKQTVLLGRMIQPLEEFLRKLMTGETGWIEDSVLLYFRDLHDHCKRVTDTLNIYRDTLSGMVDMYLSLMSNRTNDVMKILAIIATIFMPLTFIAGLYGMNFEHMPELKWPWGYPVVLLVMVFVGIGMGWYIKSRKWL
ncbi:MAG: magnesium/cobalt transporter CorA [SAR324 cluster bacterium]|nr:magnesium/cobalt transporter CorA [SAR324 cluster bacterium]